ncbi:hypothetical protein L211DRAFT_432503 [Terfezia boudieri ATCC MYA-4762]|uniref:Uncharacterized protein n=1 Tax=Terfezia boudieri ATCC MYA-4762 TaxID=1051890 RepID=A0A3N4LIZ5_9PEZI|nr:hypothetical protein L211DRAFT_432503 [Terfezia boudieri ATCC MYA-4762]
MIDTFATCWNNTLALIAAGIVFGKLEKRHSQSIFSIKYNPHVTNLDHKELSCYNQASYQWGFACSMILVMICICFAAFSCPTYG